MAGGFAVDFGAGFIDLAPQVAPFVRGQAAITAKRFGAPGRVALLLLLDTAHFFGPGVKAARIGAGGLVLALGRSLALGRHGAFGARLGGGVAALIAPALVGAVAGAIAITGTGTGHRGTGAGERTQEHSRTQPRCALKTRADCCV